MLSSECDNTDFECTKNDPAAGYHINKDGKSAAGCAELCEGELNRGMAESCTECANEV